MPNMFNSSVEEITKKKMYKLQKVRIKKKH